MQLVKIINPKSKILNNTKTKNPNDRNIFKERFVLNFELRCLNLFRVWCLGFRIFGQNQGAD